MGKQVFLNLGNGNLYQGFPFVTIRLQEDTKTMEYAGSLPAAPQIVDTYRRWQLLYELLYKSRSFELRSRSLPTEDEDDGIAIDRADITHVSAADFADVCQELQQRLDLWLASPEFLPLERQLRKQLNPNDEISLIVQTEDSHLRKLPWYIWQFFDDYPQAEVSLGSFNFEPTERTRRSNRRVRILAVLGNSTGINIEQDHKLLAALSDTEIEFSLEPRPQELNEKLWDESGWDILFFAGHSHSFANDSNGQIHLNQRDSLSIPQLKNALNKAIANGLQLAIFNSCAGLGLAAQLTTLALPQMIVMREPVPDRVAQEFLKYCLTAYAAGRSFLMAVREARERLQGIEGDFPGASWLPVIFQNPAEIPPTWEQLRRGIEPSCDYAPRRDLQDRDATFEGEKISNTRDVRDNADTLSETNPSTGEANRPLRAVNNARPKLSTIFCLSSLVTVMVIGLRWLGVLQYLELQAFDVLQNQLPKETVDSRLLIVGADDRDLDIYGYPLPDRILTRVLTNLEQHQPAAIGIDIFRPHPVPKNDLEGYGALVNRWQENPYIVIPCFGDRPEHSVQPPPQSPSEQVGFTDLYDDREVTGGGDDTVRRYLLSRSPRIVHQASACATDYSFALQLIYRYYLRQNIPVTITGESWQFGDTVVKPLETRSGGYQTLDSRGNQLLIAYRRIPQIAQQINIRDILEQDNNIDPDWIKNRVVLIGVTQQAIANDIHDTPQGEMHGVHVHAHAISQILSAVADNRPLIWWLPFWGDWLYIGFWSITGGITLWIWHRSLFRSLGLAVSSLILITSCWLILIKGGWMPLLPSAIALYTTAGLVIIVVRVRNQLVD